MSSAFAESKRSESRQSLSRTVLSDVRETDTNKLRHTATVIEDSARHIIAYPAFEAARIELLFIESLIEQVTPHVHGSIPLAFYTCQRMENSLAVLWRAYVDHRAFGAFNADTLSDLLARGIDPPDFSNVTNRDEFLQKFNTSDHTSMTLRFMENLYVSAIQVLEKSQELLNYTQALTIGFDDATFQGVLPTSVRTLDVAKSN